MPRSTALESRYTDDRLVFKIASQSSGFIRSSRLSRVMPALLTRIPTAPSCASMSAIAASTLAGTATSSTRPRPLRPAAASAAEMSAAPAAVVAVPSAVAPWRASASRIARPMPREAPVTSATWPSTPKVAAVSLLIVPLPR